MNKSTESEPLSDTAEASDIHDTPTLGKKLDFKHIIGSLKNIKELIALAGFFGLGAVAVVNYFATRDQLDEFKCFTQINVRMLQANANVNYTSQLAKQGRSELRDNQHMLDSAKNAASETEITTIQNRIDDLGLQAKSFEKSIETEKNAAERCLKVLTQNSCLVKEQRTEILNQLTRGEF